MNQLANNIFTQSHFWTEQQCESFISKAENIGFELSTIETEKGQKRMESVRNNERVIYEDHELAKGLWNQLKSMAPPKIGNSEAIGLNEMFRIYKYQPGQEFKKHRDQSFIRNETEASYFTFMIYLNDDYEGGETTFNDIVIKASEGMALIFLHDLEHAGNTVTKGTKYVLRTDIMYRLMEFVQ